MPTLQIVVPVYQSAPWIGRCIASLRRQSHGAFRAVVLDDASDDGTFERAERAIDGDPRFTLVRAPERRFQLANRLTGVRLLDPPPEAVLVFVDGDDWLLGRHALRTVARTLADPTAWMSYGSYLAWKARWTYRLRLVGPHGPWHLLGLGRRPSTQAYPPEALRDRTIRQLGWRAGHLLACRRFLWDGVRDTDLRDSTGAYLQSATDVAVVFPMLEMAGDGHVRHVKKALYVYNRANPLRRRRLDTAAQKALVQDLCARPPYPAAQPPHL